MSRKSEVKRSTKETDVSVTLDMDGPGEVRADTGTRFVDHLLVSLGTHAGVALDVAARSNDGIGHHLVEDTAIVVGQAIDEALGDRKGVARFAHAAVPMDESLAEASVDLVRRPYQKLDLSIKGPIEGVPREDLEHFFESLLRNMSSCIHLEVRYGKNDHHKVEAAIKSLAVALRSAAARDGRGVPSTKGSM